MSNEQLAELEVEMASISARELADEKMLMAYEIRFWRQKAWRAEQQKDREILARKEVEAKLERFKGLSQETLEEMSISLKNKDLTQVKSEANKLIGVSPWVKYLKEEELIKDLDAKIKFWIDLVAYYNKEWREGDE